MSLQEADADVVRGVMQPQLTTQGKRELVGEVRLFFSANLVVTQIRIPSLEQHNTE